MAIVSTSSGSIIGLSGQEVHVFHWSSATQHLVHQRKPAVLTATAALGQALDLFGRMHFVLPVVLVIPCRYDLGIELAVVYALRCTAFTSAVLTLVHFVASALVRSGGGTHARAFRLQSLFILVCAQQAHMLLALKSWYSWPHTLNSCAFFCLLGYGALLRLAACHGLWPPTWLWTLGQATEATAYEEEAADGFVAEGCRWCLALMYLVSYWGRTQQYGLVSHAGIAAAAFSWAALFYLVGAWHRRELTHPAIILHPLHFDPGPASLPAKELLDRHAGTSEEVPLALKSSNKKPLLMMTDHSMAPQPLSASNSASNSRRGSFTWPGAHRSVT